MVFLAWVWCSLAAAWIWSGAPFLPMKGRSEGWYSCSFMVPTILSHRLWARERERERKRLWDPVRWLAWDRLVVCMAEELYRPLSDRCLDWRELCISILPYIYCGCLFASIWIWLSPSIAPFLPAMSAIFYMLISVLHLPMLALSSSTYVLPMRCKIPARN